MNTGNGTILQVASIQLTLQQNSTVICFYFKFFIDFLQGFYIYIYTVSIIFLIYAYVYLLRNKSLKLRRNLRRNHYSSPSSGSRSNLKRKYSFDDSRTYHTGSFYLRLGAVGRQMHLRIFWFANKWYYVRKIKYFDFTF